MNIIDRIIKFGITCNAETEQGVRYFHCGCEYVEIGGIKWATMNVGANSITDKGLFFQWGDTQGYTASQVGSGEGQKYFNWDDYKYCNGTSRVMTKYNAIDNKTVLEFCDDAVTAAWGGSWRMPTTAEFQALANAVTTVWTTDYQSSGVNGLVCTDKTDESKVLFFPAVGYAINCTMDGVGNCGAYWTSSRSNSFSNDSFYFVFGQGNVDCDYYGDRYFGFSVRGVVD